jgi:hypothetical protein
LYYSQRKNIISKEQDDDKESEEPDYDDKGDSHGEEGQEEETGKINQNTTDFMF